ncbi:MAG: anaerobic magnesium-protoporphyrin IX monomethyl ester cyclase elongator protein [uncultured bacterium]|nr:MAG: anaerobic magnesium-protoporphyrin IX monomethyl ester cyclase elongator protein [uncultured bacterium]
MRILLINPPRENEIIGNNPSIIEKERGYNPPLGLLYVAAYIKKNSRFDVNIIDSQVEGLNYNSLKEKIREISPDVVGITCMSLTLLDVIKTVEIVKETKPSSKIVLGGPHVHLFPEETISLPNIDFLVLGEGEITFHQLLTNINDYNVLKNIKGIVFKNNGQIINTGYPELISNLDILPFPARDMVPFKKYSSLFFDGKTITTVITSRGCPFKCSFCNRPHLGKKFRARTSKNVVDEIEECVKMGIRCFLFYDDTFTVNKQRVLDICNEILHRQLDICWDIRSRVDTIDEQMLNLLKQAGCNAIHYGVETGTAKILKILRKDITLDLAEKTFLLTKKYKIKTLAYFMIGNPDETEEDIHTTFKVMKQLNPDYVHLTIFSPFPGTDLYNTGLESGIIKNDCWREFASNPKITFTAPYWNDKLSINELKKLLAKGYKTFYIRPYYIFKTLIRISSLNHLKKLIFSGIRVFLMK